MSNKTFTASKTRSNRPGWSITFRHPLRTDSRGDKGLKVRRGLGTSDETEADDLVEQMNLLLSDQAWWSGDRRQEASEIFDERIVAAFFDGMESFNFDAEKTRNEKIPLPTREDGYSSILFLGTTGAGKTTLLRHIVGSDHQEDRFPSTSTAKTTTADFEIITAPGDYSAAITFMPEQEVRAHIDECLEEACLEAAQEKADAKIAAALLEHREQRFRLSYVLGTWSEDSSSKDDEFAFEEDDNSEYEIAAEETVPDDERQRNLAQLKRYVLRIKEMSASMAARLEDELGKLADQQTADDRATWLELFASEVFQHGEFSSIAIDLLEDISDRFSKIDAGDIQYSATEWPLLWTYQASNREAFLQSVRWFSSNHHKQFGRLLTPLVNGVRVIGPLFPATDGLPDETKLILLDGQGLGHTAKSVSSISTRITNRFAGVDLVLLVDNAQQPMQAAPLALLRAIGSSGFAEKLGIAFTHFDQVKGANLGSFEQKKEHVLASVNNAIYRLRDEVGASVSGAIERQVDSRSVFLGGLDRPTEKLPGGFKRELTSLIEVMQKSNDPLQMVECGPVYEFKGLEIAVHDAIDAFRAPWKARLGLGFHDGISKEHWTRVKALSRRLANGWADEYDTLTPVADLLARLQEEASKWLEQPSGWHPRQPNNDEERDNALDQIRRSVFAQLYELTQTRIADDQLQKWRQAYDYRGSGSANERSRMIASIHDYAAPQINAGMSKDARDFLSELYDILKNAIIDAGGKVSPIQKEH